MAAVRANNMKRARATMCDPSPVIFLRAARRSWQEARFSDNICIVNAAFDVFVNDILFTLGDEQFQFLTC